jgi:hypothetical protein
MTLGRLAETVVSLTEPVPKNGASADGERENDT